MYKKGKSYFLQEASQRTSGATSLLSFNQEQPCTTTIIQGLVTHGKVSTDSAESKWKGSNISTSECQ